jgi:hypothetical protein
MLPQFYEMSPEELQAAQLLYHEFPQHYVWQTKTRNWKGTQKCGDKAIGRMVPCSPMDVENIICAFYCVTDAVVRRMKIFAL